MSSRRTHEDSYTIEISDIPPSNNRFLGKKGKNWEYNKIKKLWDELITTQITRIGRYPNMPFSKAVVDIHYVFPDRRRRDPDNYSGKMLLDPLVKNRIIEDDTFRNITLKLSAEVEPRVRRTVIKVIAVESDINQGTS